MMIPDIYNNTTCRPHLYNSFEPKSNYLLNPIARVILRVGVGGRWKGAAKLTDVTALRAIRGLYEHIVVCTGVTTHVCFIGRDRGTLVFYIHPMLPCYQTS